MMWETARRRLQTLDEELRAAQELTPGGAGRISGLYELKLVRARRGWNEEERLSWAPVLERGDGSHPSEAALVSRIMAKGSPGTLAIKAYRAWQVYASHGSVEQRNEFQGRLRFLRQALSRQPAARRARETMARFLDARVQQRPTLPDRRSIVLQWEVGGEAPYPVSAVFLSMLVGLWAGCLRLCSRCQTPFVAAERRQRICEACTWSFRHMPQSKRKALERVKSRLRGRHRFDRSYTREALTGDLNQAFADLRQMRLDDWRQKWDTRRGPQGRRRASR